MAKYSDRQKIGAARDYCSGHLGLRQVAERHGVNVASLRLWAAAYRLRGEKGVLTKDRQVYSVEFKLSVLQRMRSENLSGRQAAALFNIRRHDMIGVWKRAYETGGLVALYPGAQAAVMSHISKPDAAEKVSDEKRTREELLDELNQLRLENAYLKNSRP
jgi:transposase